MDERRTIGIFPGPTETTFSERLRAQGLEIRVLPNIEFEPAERGEVVRFLDRRAEFDWLMLADVPSVDFLIKSVGGSDIDDLFADARVCALGVATAARLRYFFVHSDVICPPEAIVAGLESIHAYSVSDADPHILLITGEEIGAVPGPSLSIFKTFGLRPEIKHRIARTKALVRGGAVDDLLVTGADLAAFTTVFPEGFSSDLPCDLRVIADADAVDIVRTLEFEAVRLSALIEGV